MKTNMNQIKWMRGLGNASYIIGVAFLITSLFVNSFPPQAAGASPLKCILGCMDPSAINYNPLAEKDDGSCIYDILGCTDKDATNYNKDATKDDGSCIYDILGCTDKDATNYNKDATKDDGSCIYDILGCTDKDATNYNKDATKDDGTCVYPPPDYKLNLSHIECVEGSVEIHFVLLNVPEGITPGTLTYTYGTISPSKDTGNVWHYSDYKPEGYYNVTNASVDVGGTTVNLHNPEEYKGNYACGSPPPPCSYDPSIPADDPRCIPCEWNPQIPADDDACFEPCQWNPQIPADDDACFEPCQWNPQIPADDEACFEPCQWNPQIPADDEACFEPCQWNPAIPVGDASCKPMVSFGSCYNPIKGLFELNVVNKGVVGYYIGYDVYQEAGLTNLGFFEAGQSKSFDVPLLNGNNDTLRKYASLTGEEPWTTAGGTHVFDPNTEYVCGYDPARVEVSCNPYVEQKLTWTIHNDNNYPVDYFWTWSISSEPGGMGNIAALSSGSFTTEFKPATMQIRLGSLQFYIEPENCNIPPKDKTPTQPPRITPTVKVKTIAPPVVTPQILIPVTGVALGNSGSQQMTLVNLGLAFLGLGLVLNGFARARKDWDI